MEKKYIVRFVTVGVVALLLPLILGIPAISLTLETLVSLGGGLVAFYLITCLTARNGYRKYIAVMPVVVVIVIGISHIPITLSRWQIIGYYILVAISLVLSAGSHLLGWLGIDGSRPRFRRRREEEDEDDE